MLKQQKKQTESLHEMFAQKQLETSDAEVLKEESNEDDAEYDHTATSTNQLQTRMSRTRSQTDSPPPALSPLTRRPPSSSGQTTAGDKLVRPIAVQVRSNSAGREKEQEQEHEVRHVRVQTKKCHVVNKKARSHRRKASGATESLAVANEEGNHDSHYHGSRRQQKKARSKPRTKDGFFSWLP